METKNLMIVAVVALVVAVVASLATISLTGNTVKVSGQKIYTASEVDAKMSDLQNQINLIAVNLNLVTCRDSDGGANYFIKGTTTGLNAFNETSTTTDYCVYAGENGTYGQYLSPGQQAVMEYGCSSDGKAIYDDLHVCPKNCKSGACVK